MYQGYNLLSDLLFLFKGDAKRIIKTNALYQNIHQGETCYILGTGPSLNNLTPKQISALENEIVFGTNSLYKAKITETITPRYYALLDNLYWEQWSHTFSDVHEKYRINPPVFITDLRAKNFAACANKNHQHIHIHSKKYPTTKISDQLHKNIYAAMNVVSYCILAASYMGFKKIYLLGCDYNAFCTSGKGHAYNDSSELSQANYNLAFYLKFYWITTEFHYLIEQLTRSKNIEVINLTDGSLLDAYKRLSTETILPK
ncbi:6-hydroxymethylpterin diphosphokinase MptE-like [Comamonadaceae bacterium]